MIIESVAAAGMLLQQINSVIQQVNEGKANVQTAMGLVSDFGDALNQFEVTRKTATFNPLSTNDILKLQMLRRSQERYQYDLRQLLLVADPKLLEDYDNAIRKQAEDRRAHAAMIKRRQQQREKLKQQIKENPVLMYMKGTPYEPRCGFSSTTVQALIDCGAQFSFVDILENQEVRATLPSVTDWPTFPQVFISGELIGGCDIVAQMHESGELQKLVDDAVG